MANHLNLLDPFIARQFGMVHTHQLRELGISDTTRRSWVATGRLIVVHPSVYRVQGAPLTWEARVMAAVLATGGRASHRSAARLWGLGDSDLVEVVVERRQSFDLPGVLVHRARDLDVKDVIRRHRIPTTTPMRAIADLAAVLSFEDVLTIAGDGISKQLFGQAALEAILNRIGRRGRPGTKVLRQVTDELALILHGQPDSVLEIRMLRLERDFDVPHFDFQVWLADDLRVDLCRHEERIVLETDGFACRSNPVGLTNELDRQNRIVELGYLPVRFSWPRVVRTPAFVAGTILRTIAMRRRDLGLEPLSA